MKRVVTSLTVGGTLAAAALALVGCGSGDTSQGAASTASTTPAREAASKPAPEKCPDARSLTYVLTIINKTESVLYPSAEGWACEDWSGWGNPSVLNGWAIGPGQEKRLNLEKALWDDMFNNEFTINFRFGTTVRLSMEDIPRMLQGEGKSTSNGSMILPGRFGPNTIRATFFGRDGKSKLALEQIAPNGG